MWLLKWTKMVLPLEWTDYNLVKLTYSEKRHFNKNDGSWRHSEYARKLHFSKIVIFSKSFISENWLNWRRLNSYTPSQNYNGGGVERLDPWKI